MSVLFKAAALVLALALSAFAQDGTMKLVFNSEGSEEQRQITITAKEVIFERDDGVTIFKGGVKVFQENIVIRASEVRVHSVPDDFSEVEFLLALGGVELETDGGSATADRGRYDVAARRIILEGDVEFTAEETTLTGQHLTYDVDTGQSRLVGGATASIETGDE